MLGPAGDNTLAREPAMLLWGGRGAFSTRLRGNRVFLVYAQTPMDDECPCSCGCAVTLTSSPGACATPQVPPFYLSALAQGRKAGASALQTNASAAARWGVPPHCGCAGARPPAVTAVARGERRSPGACAGGFAGARGKFAPSARQPGRRRRRRREAEPGDHPPSPSPQSPHVPQPHLTSHPSPSDPPNPGMAAPANLPGRTSGRQRRL